MKQINSGYTMKCRMMALLAMVVAFSTVQAQKINFKISVTQIYDEAQSSGKTITKKEPVLSKLELFTYGVENRANTAARRFVEGYALKKGEGDCYDSKKVNARGEANNVQADARGYAVLTMGLAQIDTAIVIPISKYYDANSNTVIFSTEVYGGRVLKTVDKTGKQKAREDKQGSARIYGNKVVVKGQIRLDSAYTRDDARFVGAPRLVIVNSDAKGKDKERVVHYFDPIAFDGQPYEETQYRRMQFNLANDKLNKNKINRDRQFIRSEVYHDGFRGQDSIFMQTSESYLFDYQAEYSPYDRSKKYLARLHRWYEDYNKVYKDDPDFIFWDGNVQNPMQFLDWSSARSMLDIDPLEYKKEEKSEISQSNRSYKLEFETGKTSLNQEDSLTMAELSGLKDRLQLWYNDVDADVHKVSVKGYASPEGGYATNKTLAAGRSQNLMGILRGQAGAGKVKAWHHDSDVVSWDEVADSLELRIATPEAIEAAQAIRLVTSATKDRDAQARQIQAAPYFKYLQESNALKMVRRVNITIEYVATRILTPEEIYEKYVKDDPKGYREGIGEKDYEYYHLMNRLYAEERWDELYTISKAAYKNVEITGEQATKARRKLNPDWTPEKADTLDKYYIEEDRQSPYFRPYSLAAYYLSICKLRKEEADTLLLADFLDDHRKRINKDPDLGQGFGIWNDPAIVVNHILMFCYAMNFDRAEYYALNWLPDDPNDPNYQTFHNLSMFVGCLNGRESDPEVQDYIKSTSPMNHAVIAAAQDTEAGYKEALEILNDPEKVDNDDPKVHYLKAICRFRLNPFKDYEHPAYPAYNIYDKDGDEVLGKRDFAAPMLEALRLNPDYMKQLEVDGYFNDAYRRMVKYFWYRLQQGAEMPDICREYDELRQKYTVK